MGKTLAEIRGPGTWHMLRSEARDAITEPKKLAFKERMTWTCKNFGCEVCETHCLKYIEDHPMDFYWNRVNEKGEFVGLFQWIWAFNNSVNNRLGKPLVDWKTAYEAYYGPKDGAICNKDCGH